MAIAKRIFLFLLTNALVMISLIAVLAVLRQFLPPEFFDSYYSMTLIIAVLFGFGGSLISLLISRWSAKRMMGVQVIPENTHESRLRGLLDTTHRLARKAGIQKMPEVGIYESDELNAFATGASKNKALVAVSSGLLHRMDSDELEGVLGHEIAHVANGDMVTMALVQGVVNSVVLFLVYIITNLIESALRGDSNRGGLGFFGRMIVHQILFSLLAFAAAPLVTFVSRWREYRADAGSAKLAGREKMIKGLQKLQAGLEQVGVDESHKSIATMKISNKASGGLMRFWMTHPPIADRIRRLQTGR